MHKSNYVFMRLSKRVIYLCCSSFLVFSMIFLTACTPQNHAVGDSGYANDIVHDGIDVEDINLLIVGSKSASLDSKLLHICEKSGLRASYSSISDVKNVNFAATHAIKDASNRPVSMILINGINVDAMDGVDSGVKSNAGGAHVDLKSRRAWIDALKYARSAGIPVALVNPVNPPKDATLYAAKLYILKGLDNQDLFYTINHVRAKENAGNDDANDSGNASGKNVGKNVGKNTNRNSKIQYSSLLKIVQSIIDNTPHSRDVIINDKN